MSALLLVLVAVVSVPVIVLFIQSVSMLFAGPIDRTTPAKRPRVAILIPAHDESASLASTLRSVLSQLVAGDRCLVVADNCIDDTAAVATGLGAEVVERRDQARRGKSFALAFGIEALSEDPPTIVVVVDADCVVSAGAIERIASLAFATTRPVQARYLMISPEGAGRMSVIAEFAMRVKNWGRPVGYLRLGLPCQLMGTGMALPWICIRAIDIASGHLAEDVKMGIDFTRRGMPPIFCPEALVTSAFPLNRTGVKSQRTRWEHGHLGLIVSEVPSLVRSALARRSLATMALALDLAVPPLALLTLVVAGSLVLTAAATIVGVGIWPLLLSGVVLLLLIVAVALFWLRLGADILSFSTLLLAIPYALRKVPVYLGFAFHRETRWIKSKRDVE